MATIVFPVPFSIGVMDRRRANEVTMDTVIRHSFDFANEEPSLKPLGLARVHDADAIEAPRSTTSRSILGFVIKCRCQVADNFC